VRVGAGPARAITLVAASGDWGAAQFTCDGGSFEKAVINPASDPLVLGAGGTALDADPLSGAYISESAWNESADFGVAGGGGYSEVYPRPRYQRPAVSGARRGLPDVAYSAALDGGVVVYGQGVQGAGFYIFSGTSAGAPQCAALVAMSAQVAGHRVGAVNDSVYSAAARPDRATYFRDVTEGDNTFSFTDPSGVVTRIPGYPAAVGWDPATGIGSPIAEHLVPYLATDSRGEQ